MAEQSAIEWCDSTFNPWIGCTKVSPGCDHCYAEQRMDKRLHTVTWGPGQPRKRTSPANWRQPIKWNAEPFYQCQCGWRGADKQLARTGPAGFCILSCPACGDSILQPVRQRVFCASLADVFDNEVEPQWRSDLFDLIKATPNLDWLLLTKRIGNAWKMMADALGVSMASALLPLPNVWLGATIVNQEEANRDIPKLLQIPATKLFLSMEPLLGPVNITRIPLRLRPIRGGEVIDGYTEPLGRDACIQWVIVGGESGPDARDCDIGHIHYIVDQCKAAGVAVHVKQLGSRPVWTTTDGEPPHFGRITFRDKKGGDMAEWPKALRVREFPKTVEVT